MAKGNWKEFSNSFESSKNKILPTKENEYGKSKFSVQKQKSGKKGKTVTSIKLIGIENKEAKKILQGLQKLCGTGGTFKNENIELQGDQVEIAIRFLKNWGL